MISTGIQKMFVDFSLQAAIHYATCTYSYLTKAWSAYLFIYFLCVFFLLDWLPFKTEAFNLPYYLIHFQYQIFKLNSHIGHISITPSCRLTCYSSKPNGIHSHVDRHRERWVHTFSMGISDIWTKIRLEFRARHHDFTLLDLHVKGLVTERSVYVVSLC